MGAVVVLSGFFAPPIFAALERIGGMLTTVVTTASTWMLLAPIYYLCFAFCGLIMRARGIDPMRRRWDAKVASYWTERAKTSDPKDYTRQY